MAICGAAFPEGDEIEIEKVIEDMEKRPALALFEFPHLMEILSSVPSCGKADHPATHSSALMMKSK